MIRIRGRRDFLLGPWSVGYPERDQWVSQDAGCWAIQNAMLGFQVSRERGQNMPQIRVYGEEWLSQL